MSNELKTEEHFKYNNYKQTHYDAQYKHKNSITIIIVKVSYKNYTYVVEQDEWYPHCQNCKS